MSRLTISQFNASVVALSRSSRELAKRFGQIRTKELQLRLIREECQEVMDAQSDAHRIEELCDLLVVSCGLADTLQLQPHKIKRLSNIPLHLNNLEYCLDSLCNTVLNFTYMPLHNYTNMIVLECFMVARLIENSKELFPQQVRMVIAKNAAKTTETHYLSADGKIRRRGG